MISGSKLAVKRLKYRELTGVKVPRIAWSGSRSRVIISSTTQLYWLRILEGDANCIAIDGIVKVRYIGYGKDFDEWRKQEDNANLEYDDSSAEKCHHFCVSLSCQQFQSSTCTRNLQLE